MNSAMVGGNQMLAGQGLDNVYAETSSGSPIDYLSDALGSTVAVTDSEVAPYVKTTG
jgi:hypothetical protein